jgi:hypothetical protein
LSNNGTASGTTSTSEQPEIPPPSYHWINLDERHEEGDVGGSDAGRSEVERQVQAPTPLYTRSRYPISRINPVTGGFHTGMI